MKKYYHYAIVFAFAFNVLGAVAQNSSRMTTEPGSVVLNFHAAPSLTKISNSAYSDAVNAKAGFSGGVDAVYYFMSFKNMNIGVSLGLNYSYYSSGIKLNYSDSLWTVDADGENVHLYEKGDRLSETQKLSAINVPVLLRFDYPLAGNFDMYLNAGMYVSMLVSKKYSTTMDYTARGYYPQYNATLFNVDVANSPYFYPTNKAMSSDGKLKLKSNIGMQMALGCKYSISPVVALTAGINACLGLSNMANNSGRVQPLVNSDREINSMAGKSGNTKANAFAFELGISWKPAWLQKKKHPISGR